MKKSDGFSLIEVLTVMGIIGILSSVSMISLLKLVPWYKLKSSTNEVASAMNSARFKSIMYKGEYGVFFDRKSQPNSYAVFKDNNKNKFFDDKDTVVGGFSFLPAGVKFKDIKFGKVRRETVVFKEKGTLSTGFGSVYLAGISEEYKVVVSMPGRIRIERIN